MYKPWYQQTEGEVRAFFEVDPAQGLSQSEALKRLARFKQNNDPRLSSQQQRALKATVVRAGRKERISITHIVPGDIVVLKAGDRVPADIRLVSVDALVINQGMLTGEPLPVSKNTFALNGAAVPSKQKSMAFAGSFVTSGQAIGVVVERGQKTLLAKSPKRRIPKIGLKGAVIARRLIRYGVIVQNKRALGIFRKVDTVVIDAAITNSEIVEIIRKVQLTRNIDCKFIVDPKKADSLKRELGGTAYDAYSKVGNLLSCQFVTSVNNDNSLALISQLKQSGRCVLWLSDGVRATLAMRGANISFVCGDDGRDDVILASDIFAPKARPTILTRILYNKK